MMRSAVREAFDREEEINLEGLDKRLRAYGRSTVPEPNESKIKDTIVSAKTILYQNAEKNVISYFEFFYDQTRYIRKRWWGLQLLLLFLTGWFAYAVKDVQLIHPMLGIAASLFVIMVIPELWKNRSSNAMEIEEASYFSIRQIYSARLLAFSVVDGLLLTIFALTLSMTGRVIVEELIVQFFLPMTVTCCICFRSLCSRYAASEYMACALSLFWTFLWMQIVWNDRIYRVVAAPVWVGICGIAALYLTYLVSRMLRESGWRAETCKFRL